MRKRLTEEAFEFVIQHSAAHAKRTRTSDPPPLDTVVFETCLMNISDRVNGVVAYVETPGDYDEDYEVLFDNLARYVGKDPIEPRGDVYWTDAVLSFLGDRRLDLLDLARKFREWRCQFGLGNLSKSLSGQFRHVPANLVKDWLQQDTMRSFNDTLSATLYQVLEIYNFLMSIRAVGGGDQSILEQLTNLSDIAPPPRISRMGFTDDETESEDEE